MPSLDNFLLVVIYKKNSIKVKIKFLYLIIKHFFEKKFILELEGLRISVDATFKICIFGDSGVGKTSLIRRFLTERFEVNIESTMGIDISTKNIVIEGLRINLQLWDFVGEDRFKALLPIYSRGSFGGIFMYDISNESSIKKINDWLNNFKSNIPERIEQIPILVVGGKSDLNQKKVITIEDAIISSKNQPIFDYIECSSKTGENVEKVFYELTLEIMKRLNFL